MRYSILFALLLSSLAWAQSPAPKEVRFAAGSVSTQIQDTLSGYDVKEYKFWAQAGQVLKLRATSDVDDGRWMVLQVRRAKSEEADVFNNFISGDLGGDSELKETGDYILRVGLRKAEAERGGKLKYTIKLEIPPVKGMMAEAKYKLDQTSDGKGTYQLESGPAHSISRMKVQLEKSGAAHLEVFESDGTSFVLIGKWQGRTDMELSLTLSSGIGGRTLTGSGGMVLREGGGFEQVKLEFTVKGSSKARTLYFKSN